MLVDVILTLSVKYSKMSNNMLIEHCNIGS